MLGVLDTIFRSKSPILAGLDMSSMSVKALVLNKVGERYQVESYGVLPLPPNAIIDNHIKDSEAVAAVVRELFNASTFRVKNAAIAVPDSSVISKIIQMDAFLSSAEIEEQIVVEAERHIPLPLEEVSLDFEVLGPSSKGSEWVDVLLVASHTENVQSRVTVLMNAGITTKVVDVDSYAIQRACTLLADQLPDKGAEKTIAVVDIGATMTTLTVLYDMTTIFTRSEVFGGRQLTEEIQRHYGFSQAEAGLAKKQGGLPEDYVTEVLQPFKESLLLYVRRALQFFFSTSDHVEINHLVLAGGTAAIPGLAEFIAEHIGIPATVANPFVDMLLSPSVNATALTNDAPALMTCCGLALRSFM